MKIPKFNFKKIKEFFGKLPRILGEHHFLTLLAFILLALILGGLTFYQYSFLAERTEPEVWEKPLHFHEKTFQEILKIWENRQKRFEEAELKEYPDLFRASAP